MKFICPEFNSNTNDLYRKENIEQSVISDGNNLLTKSSKITTNDGTQYSYTNDTLRSVLFNQYTYNAGAYNPADWITYSELSGADYTNINECFDWMNHSAADIRSSYFYTILSEAGIYFALPKRISTSKEIRITESNIISQFLNSENDFSYQNETGEKFYISESSKDTVKPLMINAILKSHCVNKYKSQQNIIVIQSGVDANPLDYCLYKGNYYILLSRTQIKNDLYLYTCVKEENETNTFTSTDIIYNDKYIIKNYEITATVSSDNLTVTYGGLSITLAAGTNWMNLGASEVATKKNELFVYRGYNETDGVVLGISRIPYARKYSDFSATNTNFEYCAISTITNATATDVYEVIGRIDAILSAGAGYTWSLPGSPVVINEPIKYSEMNDFVPTVTANGSMTISSLVINICKIRIENYKARAQIDIKFTVGGTASDMVFVTLPAPRELTFGYMTSGWGRIYNAGTIICAIGWNNTSTTQLMFQGAWTTGTNREIRVEVLYDLK